MLKKNAQYVVSLSNNEIPVLCKTIQHYEYIMLGSIFPSDTSVIQHLLTDWPMTS